MVGMEQLLLLNPEYASEEEAAQYPVREAARAVVMDAENNVALLRVANKNYYKLPGGGCEGNESLDSRYLRTKVGVRTPLCARPSFRTMIRIAWLRHW